MRGGEITKRGVQEQTYSFQDVVAIVIKVVGKFEEESEDPKCIRCANWFKQKAPLMVEGAAVDIIRKGK